MKKIVVASVIANKHRSAGAVWTSLSWALGLRSLGLDTYFVEQIGSESCVDSAGSRCAFADSANLAAFERAVAEFGLAGNAALILNGGAATHGLTWPELQTLAADAEAIVNISGHLEIAALFGRFRRKIYIDLDPGFTQIWEATGIAGARLEGHDFYFTVGENIGRADCRIPTSGYNWRPIRQPAFLDRWPAVPPESAGRFTTIASWRGPYGPLQFEGNTLGVKAHEWRKFIDLPQRVVDQRFEIALDIHPADGKDLDALQRHEWWIVDPQAVAPDVAAMQRYIQESSAEFSVAQGVYVGTNSGWVSDRTVCYLASGRPALVQDTGFSSNYECGLGLMPFRTLEEAVCGAESIARDYARHCVAARELATREFAAPKVLGSLLEQIGVDR